jgi:hypothetical protein
MRVIYNGYQHPENEVNLASFLVRPLYSSRHRRTLVRYEAHLTGEIIIDDTDTTTELAQAKLTTRINELVNAYGVNGGDYILLDNQGNQTRHSLISGDSLSGVRVEHRSWPKGDPAEWATHRTFYIVLVAEYVEAESQIVSWQERVQVVGNGGPDWEMRRVRFGLPRPQLLSNFTPVSVVQQGEAVGLQGYPIPPGPIFPAWEHEQLRQITPGSAESYPNGFINFPLRWAYIHTTPTYTEAWPTSR